MWNRYWYLIIRTTLGGQHDLDLLPNPADLPLLTYRMKMWCPSFAATAMLSAVGTLLLSFLRKDLAVIWPRIRLALYSRWKATPKQDAHFVCEILTSLFIALQWLKK